MTSWSLRRIVQSWMLNVVVLGLGLVSAIAGYQNNSPVVVASGATASVGSFVSFLLYQLPRAYASELDNRVRDLETQLAQAREEAATMQQTISRSSSSNNASTARNTSTTRRRSLLRPPDSLTSALLSSSNSVSLLNSNSDVDSTPPPQYHTPPSRSAIQYFPSAKLELNRNTDSASSNFTRSTSRCPSFTSKLTNPSYKPSANSRRPLPTPSYRSSGHRTLSVSSKVSLPKPDTSAVNNNYLVRSAPSSKPTKPPVLSIFLSLPPPSYSRHDKFLDSCTSGATKKASNAIVKPNRPLPTKLQPILEFPNISAPAPAPTRAIQHREPSPLRHALPEYNLEDHPSFQTGSFRFEQFRVTAASESKKHFGIRKNGKSMMKGTMEKISGGKNSKVVRIVSKPPGAEFFIN